MHNTHHANNSFTVYAYNMRMYNHKRKCFTTATLRPLVSAATLDHALDLAVQLCNVPLHTLYTNHNNVVWEFSTGDSVLFVKRTKAPLSAVRTYLAQQQ